LDLVQFIETFKDAITRKVIQTYPPLYRPSPNGHELGSLKRRPLGGQADAIRATVLSLKVQRGTTVVGEMGTGKTFIAASAAYLAGFQRVLVLCPPHLVRKWQREVLDTVPGAGAAIVRSITDLEQLRCSASRPLFVILSRERAKLSYRWRPAVVLRWATSRGQLLRHTETQQPFRVPCCPTCFAQVLDEDGVPITPEELARKKHRCAACREPLWQADPAGPRRFPLADYIKRRMKGFFDLLISDEVHEYKARGSAQGIAAGVLAEACPRSLTLTGTLMGGYASTLFYLLYRFVPAIRNDFGYREEGRWVSRYGFLERVVSKHRGDDPFDDGRMSRRRGYRTRVQEKPGVTPAVLFHLIGHTVFLRLSDVASALPPYEERVLLTRMEEEPGREGLSQADAYQVLFTTLRQALVEALAQGSKRLLATYLQTLLAYPDGCTRGETVLEPRTQEVLAQVPPLPEDRLYPKEQALVELVARERMQGRRVLVYVTHTATRDITERLEGILQRHGFRAAVLKADSVPPEKREEWVARRVQEGVEVLLCHPRLVQTGLDLVDFPTIVWFEVEYSIYTMRQASRRSWRIGQTRPVTVVYMAYRNTLQAEALKLVAKKLQSSLAVEGELPEDGLAAYGDDGHDLMLALARRIVQEGQGEEESLEEVFARARQAEGEAERLLVDGAWAEEESPEPVAATERPAEPAAEVTAELQAEALSWEEFLALEPPKSRRGRAQAPASMSLFQWALGLEGRPDASSTESGAAEKRQERKETAGVQGTLL
jgi:hypothetical protein